MDEKNYDSLMEKVGRAKETLSLGADVATVSLTAAEMEELRIGMQMHFDWNYAPADSTPLIEVSPAAG